MKLPAREVLDIEQWLNPFFFWLGSWQIDWAAKNNNSFICFGAPVSIQFFGQTSVIGFLFVYFLSGMMLLRLLEVIGKSWGNLSTRQPLPP
jgi:hypothetical protein